jgi:hypothetical protein
VKGRVFEIPPFVFTDISVVNPDTPDGTLTVIEKSVFVTGFIYIFVPSL